MANLKVNFTANTTGIQAGINRIQAGISKLKASAGGLASSFAKIAVPIAVPIAGLGALIGGLGVAAAAKDVLDYGGQLDDLSTITEIAVSDLVQLQTQFALAGVEADSVQKVLGKLSATMNEPSSAILDVLDKLGLKLSDLKKMGVADMFRTIGKAIGGLDSVTEKIAASQALFGKQQGTGLVTLFKTASIADEASEMVGKLGGTMEKYAASFARIGDVVDSVHIKVRQFMAAFLGANVDRLTTIANTLAKLDFTNIGTSLGESLDKVIDTLIAAFQQGKLFSTLWNGLSATIRKAGELLVSVFILASQHLTRAIEDQLRGTKLGGYLNVPEDKLMGTLEDGRKIFHRTYSTPEPEPLSKIIERNTNLLGSSDSISKFFEPLKDVVPPEKPYVDPWSGWDKIEAERKAISEMVRGAMLGTPEILEGKGIHRVTEKEPASFEADSLKPVLSSLAKIGGASAFTGNPLVSIQKRANSLLETIAANTSKRNSAAPVWS